LTDSRILHVVDGATGDPRWTARPPHPAGAERWEHLVIANFDIKGGQEDPPSPMVLESASGQARPAELNRLPVPDPQATTPDAGR
jgi:hypothetical protein